LKSQIINSNQQSVDKIIKVTGEFNRKKFARLLKEKRIQLGLTKKELGSYINRKQMQIQRYETESDYEDLPQLNLFVDLCVQLQINPNDLLNVNLSYEDNIANKEKLIDDYNICKDRMYWKCKDCKGKNVDYDNYVKINKKKLMKKQFECEHCSSFYNGINLSKLKY